VTPAESTQPRLETPGAAVTAPPSFEEIFAREGPFVGRVLHYLGVAEADLEDVTQEVFVVVLRHLPTFKGGSSRAWVRQICVWVAQNYRRSRRRRREDPVADLPDTPSPALQHASLEEQQLRARLFSLLDELPEAQREVFVLHEIEEMSMAEVCETLGCLRPTAYTRLAVARSKMRSLLGARKGWFR
jgi:RNA polymerase sigma-70 factor (ECF subfamily)